LVRIKPNLEAYHFISLSLVATRKIQLLSLSALVVRLLWKLQGLRGAVTGCRCLRVQCLTWASDVSGDKASAILLVAGLGVLDTGGIGKVVSAMVSAGWSMSSGSKMRVKRAWKLILGSGLRDWTRGVLTACCVRMVTIAYSRVE
jgi:hypothetical protein